MSDVQGFLTIFTLNGHVMTAELNDVGLAQSKNVMSKSTMDGTGEPTQLAGQVTGMLNGTGQIDTTNFQILQSTWDAGGADAFTLVIGDGSTIKAGSYAGNVTLSELDVDAAADGMWNFTLAGDTSAVVFTPPS